MSTTETHVKSRVASRTEEIKARGTVQQELPMKAKPQKEHQWLQRLVGEWTYEGEMTMGPGSPSPGSKGLRASGRWATSDSG